MSLPGSPPCSPPPARANAALSMPCCRRCTSACASSPIASSPGPGQTLSTTALVHEAWLNCPSGARVITRTARISTPTPPPPLRHILVDYARHAVAAKRGGAIALDWRAQELPVEDVAAEMLTLDAALQRLGELDARLARVVELRFFGGLEVEEVAAVLGITARSVVRDWRRARLFLHEALADAP